MYRSIEECVKVTREKMGISQSEIAEYLQVDLSYIADCEENKCSFSVGMLEKLADLFGCSYEDLESGMDIYPNINLLELQDLEAMASINKIISNIIDMRILLKRQKL